MKQVEKELLLEQLRTTGHCSVRVGGFCMMPVILNRALVRICRQPASRLNIGDIVAYFIGDKLMVHRLIGRRGNLLVIRGDSESSEIHEVSNREILGVVTEINNQPLVHRLIRKVLSVWQTWTAVRQPAQTTAAGNGQSR